ncbi:hypothetical protein K4F52_007118 [Lecanicillium sp. MT-2017a]|nr:hypothetical protein K4F52_007118 [Lecanicillium sp. MT-2017a]
MTDPRDVIAWLVPKAHCPAAHKAIQILENSMHIHCSIGFDSLSRLTIDDFSEAGTQVWYDWDCSGDQTNTSWILSSGCADGFPNKIRCITIDIQGARFQVIVNSHYADWAAFSAKVDALYEQPRMNEALDLVWELPQCISPMATLDFSALPVLRHIVVKSVNGEPMEEIYVWDMERPWEPMIKASA